MGWTNEAEFPVREEIFRFANTFRTALECTYSLLSDGYQGVFLLSTCSVE
jgi:hypothetical protein